MLTRLQVEGFKNLVDVDIRFGPFTCLAGPNGVGKSNLFDAITFLSDLADKPLLEAAQGVRDPKGRAGNVDHLFHRTGGRVGRRISLAAEMLIANRGQDEFGQAIEATTTFVRYEIELERQEAKFNGGRPPLRIIRESLSPIGKSSVKSALAFPHSTAWRNRVVVSKRRLSRSATFISTDHQKIKLHPDGGKNGDSTGYSVLAETSPFTVLSSVGGLYSGRAPTASLVRDEMRSWRLLQLEPTSLRRPDSYLAPKHLAADGSHLPATLFALAQTAGRSGEGQEAVYAGIANRLALLIEDVRQVRVDDDEKRELLTLMVQQADGSEFQGSSLSDGTLRFLALSVIEADREHGGVICLEEPENGIHPKRVQPMIDLLSDISTDAETDEPEDQPLRQVIINTHSPAVVATVQEEDILFAREIESVDQASGSRYTHLGFWCMPGTWRAQSAGVPAVPPAHALSYLQPALLAARSRQAEARQRRTVAQSESLQPYLPHLGE